MHSFRYIGGIYFGVYTTHFSKVPAHALSRENWERIRGAAPESPSSVADGVSSVYFAMTIHVVDLKHLLGVKNFL